MSSSLFHRHLKLSKYCLTVFDVFEHAHIINATDAVCNPQQLRNVTVVSRARCSEATFGLWPGLRPLWTPGQGGAPYVHCRRFLRASFVASAFSVLMVWGAEESVAPRSSFLGPHLESAMRGAGASYRTASRAAISNLGEPDVRFITNEGDVGEMPFQLADIERPFVAVSALAKAGNAVDLNHDGWKITHQTTGKVTSSERRSGTCILRMWVPADSFNGRGQRVIIQTRFAA